MTLPMYLVAKANRGLSLGFATPFPANNRNARLVASALESDTVAELHALAKANRRPLTVVKLNLVRDSHSSCKT